MSSSSVVVATVEPIHGSNESLLHGLHQRSSLTLLDDPQHSLVLGRNHTTGIASQHISRKDAIISYAQNRVWIEKPVGSTKRILPHNSVICLYRNSYAYRVCIMENINNRTDDVASSTPGLTEASQETLQSTIESSSNQGNAAIAEEVMCSVCMEILVDSTAIVPCGHVFCKGCISSMSICPNCRLAFRQTIAIKAMDSLIAKLVSSSYQDIFHETDVLHYQTRVQPTFATHANSIQPVCY